MGYITKEGLMELKNYQYKSGGYSWLDNKMNPFWVYCVTLLPEWMAPNLVTLIGFFFMMSSFAIFIIFGGKFGVEELPWWTHFYCAFSHFAYQTLDAIDGKQARRTGSSSPLGQLFDHGCDVYTGAIQIVLLSWSIGLN